MDSCRLRRELQTKFQVSPGSWVKKLGLVAMLGKARRDTLDPAPHLDPLGRSTIVGNGRRKSAHPQPGLQTIAVPGMSRDEPAETAEAELCPPQRQDYATLEAKIDLLSATVAQIMSHGGVTSATGMATPDQLSLAPQMTPRRDSPLLRRCPELQGRHAPLCPWKVPPSVQPRMCSWEVICEVYPNRQGELDKYFPGIVEMANQYSGFGFYDYHLQFSVKVASWLARGVKIDWSKRDNNLYCSLFAGQRANACQLCRSLNHLTPFCPQHSGKKVNQPSQQHRDSSRQTSRPLANFGSTDRRGRPRISYGNCEICNNFNSSQGCTQIDCRNAHVCLKCQDTHSALLCTGAA